MRLLFMFGPMILRQVQRYQRNKERQQYQQNRDGAYPSRREQTRRQKQIKQAPPPVQPKLSEEEKNFRLKEEDIMLDPQVIQDYGIQDDGDIVEDNDYDSTISSEEIDTKEGSKEEIDNLVPRENDNADAKDDGFDLKDLFFEEEEGDKDDKKTEV